MQNTTLTIEQGKRIGTSLDYTSVLPTFVSGRNFKLESKSRRITRKQAQMILDTIGAETNPGDKVIAKVCNCYATPTGTRDYEVPFSKAVLVTLKINRRNPIRIAVGPGGAELDLANDISEYPGM